MRQRSRQIVKLDDVAEKAGVSPSTVSLYIRQPDRVSDKTGKKIQAAIDSLGYVHNKIASQFTGGQSSNMAVVLPSLANTFFSHVVQCIESTVSAQGFQLSIASHDHSLDKEEEQIRSILQWSPAVIAIAGADHKSSTLKMLRNSGVPVVQMWQVNGGAFPAQVGNNHEQIGYAAARYLLETGCDKLAYFTTRFDDDIRARIRYIGFCRALEEHDKTPLLVDIPRSENIWQASREILTKTLVKERGLDGIFCTSDAIGTALLMESQARGIAIPEKLSILGYGDFPSSAWLSPTTLSSVNLNADAMAVCTAEMMLKMSADRSYEGEIVDVGFEIMPRGSTRLPF
ncbi:LacI family transcriptional regulator [Enterobacter sp. 10-1]|uniref:LacI family DNA-binding transcriptional regulator n=1 Tax=Raoultella sp. 10-1 TaxID=2683201 RepID=UPI000BA3AC5F|nr:MULTISPECIES: LacI family DNA-binding transcriptional regulator [Enterobacteriaceae]MVT03932.1 LacI family DNA-binding transcriptional regulator [Raoultella sp. 10-1]PAC11545.1 LacI family transcriptional regulator [Enterobacter sp. 10-1]